MSPPTRHGLDPTDPMAMALSLKEVEGSVESLRQILQMMQQTASQSNMNLTNTLASVQSEVQRIPDRVKEDLTPINKRLTALSETVSGHKLGVRILWAVFLVVLGIAIPLVGWWNGLINDRFADAKAERIRVEADVKATHNADTSRLQSDIERVRSDVDALKSSREAR